MGILFGTDGVRGVANTELTAKLAYKLGRYGAIVLACHNSYKPKILVGTDTRISCPMLESALVAGICSAGADAYVCGVIPTPGVARLVKTYGFDAGVVISASHNSFEFNGIKFFNSEGFKLSDKVEEEIENLILKSKKIDEKWPSGADVGHRYLVEESAEDYLDELKKDFNIDLSEMKIAIDCANGATSYLAKNLLSDLGAEVFPIANEPDGININNNCGSTHPKLLSRLTVEKKCDLGLAFDGDGDRLLAIDENGKIIDGDVILAILAYHMKKEGKLKDNTLVATIMSNLGLDIFAKKNEIILLKTNVGDRYVLEEMLKSGYALGGEQSGHIILLDHSTSGDGMLSALKLLQILSKTTKKLSELTKIMNVLPQVLKGVKVTNGNKELVMEDKEFKTQFDIIEKEFNGKGRILVRPSGTEPLIRVMLEGEDLEYITNKCDQIITMISDKYGVEA